MPIDATIPLQAQTPNSMQTISSLLNIKGQQQQLQASSMANQQSQIDLQETQGAQGLMRNIKAYQDENGNIDYNKLLPDMMSVAPKNGAKFIGNVMSMQQQANQAKQSWTQASDAQRDSFGKLAYSMLGQKPEDALSTLATAAQSPNYASMAPAVQHFIDALKAAGSDQTKSDAVLNQIGKMAEAPSTQQGMNTPSGVGVDNGQQSSVISTKPNTAAATGVPIPGTSQQKQLPPGTPVVNSDGSQGYLGSQGQGGPAVFDLSGDRIRDLSMLNGIANNPRIEPEIRQQAHAQIQQMQSGRPAASLAPGQASNMQNNVDEMNRHFASLQDQSAGNQLVQGLTGNIRALADKAATGVGGDKKAYVAGLLNALGLGSQATGDLQKDTDLLNKNMAQLNLGTPASTDAMRMLVEAGRPSSKMSSGAIKDAADQVASQVQANMAMRNMLAPAKQMGDVSTYNAQRQRLETIADPRAWQYVNMGPGTPEAKAFMSKLQPADRDALIKKVEQLESMGMLK